MTDRVVTALSVVVVACVADWLATVDALAAGIASEANPVAAWMLEQGMAESFALKCGLTAACCLALYLLRDRRAARVAAYGLAIVYGSLLAWHVAGRIFWT